MRRVFERIEDCPLVEQQIWSHVATEYGDFIGVRELGLTELLTLKSLIDARITMSPEGHACVMSMDMQGKCFVCGSEGNNR